MQENEMRSMGVPNEQEDKTPCVPVPMAPFLYHEDVSSDDDDDSSFSSTSSYTTSEEDDEHTELWLTTSKHSSWGERNRSVRFDPTKNVYHENTLYQHADEAQDSWYSPREIELFKCCTSQFVRSMQCSDNAFIQELGAYSEFRVGLLTPFEIIQVRCIQENNERKTTDFHNLLTQEQRQEWQNLYTDFPERLGLERTAITRIRKDKSARRYSLLSSVNKMSRIMGAMHEDERAELVQSLCERISLPSRIFAEEMGKAVHLSCMEDASREPHGWRAHLSNLRCALSQRTMFKRRNSGSVRLMTVSAH